MKRKHMLIWIIPIILVLAYAVLWCGPARPPAPGGISRLERVRLGGVPQWISIRAANPHAPVLLFLHGGPGSANLAKLRLQVPELEQHFVVVTWDQPGAGKSGLNGAGYTSLSIEQMVADAHELVTYLKTRFGVERVYLMGFSWGTVIGLSLAKRYPQDLFAYIAVSQVVNAQDGERLSLEHLRRTVQEAGDQRAIAELAEIDPAYASGGWFSQLTTERRWLLRYRGVYHTSTSYNHEIGMLLRAHEYSLADVARWPGRSTASLKSIWPEIMGIKFDETIPSIACPVYFFLGRFDDNVPSSLGAAYFEKLDAPAGKHRVWFENSAHDLFFDEPAKLIQETLAILQEQK
jgi:pimeloyl-ACP methyl ester carboxylesterase